MDDISQSGDEILVVVRAEAQAEHFYVTLASISDAVIATDAAGHVTFLNGRAEALTGWRRAEAVGKGIAAVLHLIDADTQQPVTSPVRQVLRDRIITGLANHTLLIAQDGTARPIEASGAPIIDRSGQLLGVVLVVRDITERVQAEQERARLLAGERAARAAAEAAVRVRDQFLSVAAHELKTPLSTLMGQVQLFQRRAERERHLLERDQRTLEIISNQVARLNKRVSVLLDISRLEMGQLRIERAPVDICSLVRRIVGEVQPTVEDRTIKLRCPAAPLVVNGDELRLEQVIQNLIQNGLKYSQPPEPITVIITQQGNRICVIVQDHGVGIPAAALPQLFQRFYRADNAEALQISGMGIGLYVVKEIVTLHDGEVTVASTEGAGSAFTIWLPVDSSRGGSAAGLAARQHGDAAGQESDPP